MSRTRTLLRAVRHVAAAVDLVAARMLAAQPEPAPTVSEALAARLERDEINARRDADRDAMLARIAAEQETRFAPVLAQVEQLRTHYEREIAKLLAPVDTRSADEQAAWLERAS